MKITRGSWMPKARILIIEDDSVTSAVIEDIFTKNGYIVSTADSGEEGIELARKFKPDVIILDLMLPGIDGMEVARILRNERETVGVIIIMLSLRKEEFDIVIGLESFADNYITKPFVPRVLLAHVKALLRRKGRGTRKKNSEIILNELAIDSQTFRVSSRGDVISLTKTEFEILWYLASKPDRVFSREQIIRAVKGDDFPVTERAIDVAIVRLRKKLGGAGKYIETVRGVGYTFRQSGL